MKEHWLILSVLHLHLHIHQNIIRMQQYMRFNSIMFIRGKCNTLLNHFVFNGVIGNGYTLRLQAIMMGKVDITYGLRISLFYFSIHQTKNPLSVALQTYIHLSARGQGIYVEIWGRKLWWLAIATRRAGPVIMVSYISSCDAASGRVTGPLGTNTLLLRTPAAKYIRGDCNGLSWMGTSRDFPDIVNPRRYPYTDREKVTFPHSLLPDHGGFLLYIQCYTYQLSFVSFTSYNARWDAWGPAPKHVIT
jgi:hypothetical protein